MTVTRKSAYQRGFKAGKDHEKSLKDNPWSWSLLPLKYVDVTEDRILAEAWKDGFNAARTKSKTN